MGTVRVWLSRLLDVFVSGRRDRRVREEMQQHVDFLTEEHMSRGLSRPDAELAARKSFGGIDQTLARYRDQRGWPWLSRAVQDAGFAARQLWRDRGFTASAVLVLGLGLGVSHLFFTLTYAHTMRGLPIPDVGRVRYLFTASAQGPEQGLSPGEFADLRQTQNSFVDLAAFVAAPVTLGAEGEAPDRVEAAYTTGSAFALTEAGTIHGRLFTAEDERPGAAPVLVVTERVWSNRFGRHPNVLGGAVLVGGTPATIVGVVSDASGMPTPAAVFLPLMQQPDIASQPRSARGLRVFGRLRDEVRPADADAELWAAAARWEADFPQTNRGIRLVAVPIDERYGAPMSGWMPFLLAGLIVVAVASANVGNLMLTRAAQRARELAIRTALGASRGRVVRQLLMESALIGGVACLFGFAVSQTGLRVHQAGIPENLLPYWINYSVDSVTLIALPGLALATATVFALAPAYAASRTDVVSVLKDGGRSETGRRGAGWAATSFLAAELALAVVLLTQVGAATINSFGTAVPTDTLLDDTRVFTGSLTMTSGRGGDAGARRGFQDAVVEEMAALPGVTAVGVASHLPLGGGANRQLRVAGRPLGSGDPEPAVMAVEVSGGYFDALALAVVRGRTFRTNDTEADAAAVVINERLASLHFPGVDPVGQRIALVTDAASEAPGEWRTVVGVVPNLRQRPVADVQPIAYLPLAAPPASVWLLVRASTDAALLAAPVREALRQLDPGVPLSNPRTLAAATHDQSWAGRTSARFAAIVCIATFVLATVGLYAVVAHRAAQRRREFGLRMVLGAQAAALVQLVTRQVRAAVVLGLVFGLAGAVAWDRAFSPVRRDALRAVDPLVLVVAVAVLGLAVALGSALPIRRAIRVSPAEALRDE